MLPRWVVACEGAHVDLFGVDATLSREELKLMGCWSVPSGRQEFGMCGVSEPQELIQWRHLWINQVVHCSTHRPHSRWCFWWGWGPLEISPGKWCQSTCRNSCEGIRWTMMNLHIYIYVEYVPSEWGKSLKRKNIYIKTVRPVYIYIYIHNYKDMYSFDFQAYLQVRFSLWISATSMVTALGSGMLAGTLTISTDTCLY